MTPAIIVRRSLMLTLLGVCAAAQAAPTQLSAGQVVVDFDPDTFAFSHEVSSLGGIVTEDILPSSVDLTAVANGIKLNFNGLLNVFATSYNTFSSETLNGSFNALFNFTPTAGYTITGYSVSFEGSYSIETPGSVSVTSPGPGLSAQDGGSAPFGYTGPLPGTGSVASLIGTISAQADVSVVQVLDHVDSVLDHYEQVLDYCEPDNPTVCYYREVPVYVDVPVYRDETDLGEASINLQSITVQANVAAVPEPEGLALLALGAPLAAWLARRRRRA